MGFDLKLDGKEDILNQFTYLRDMNATAYAIVATAAESYPLQQEMRREDIERYSKYICPGQRLWLSTSR